MATDHYATLGVSPTASAADLRTAYLALARSSHPDKFEGKDRVRAQTRMQEINEAWNVLGVVHKRREYDANRRNTGAASGPSAANDTSGTGPRRGHAHFKPFEHESMNHADIDLDARPIPGSKALPQWMAFLPIGLGIIGIIVMAFSTMVNASWMFGFGLISLILGGVSFLMLPLVAMSRAERDPEL